MTHAVRVWGNHWLVLFKHALPSPERMRQQRQVSWMTWLIHVWHDSFICQRLTHVWHDSFTCDMTHSCVTWLIRVRHDSFYDSFMYTMTRSWVKRLTHVWHDSFMCVPWLIHACNLTRSYLWHDSFICERTTSCVTWLLHVRHDSFMCDMTHSCVTWLIHVWHDSFICVPWLIHMCDLTESYL